MSSVNILNGASEPTSRPRLLPERYAQRDLFVCDISDAVLKDVTPHMEHPFYSLSKKPATEIRRYEHNGLWIEITPSVKGLPTIYDKDILIYAVSAVMEKIKRGEPASQRVRMNCREFLIFANRGASGKDYDALCAAVSRLAGAQIATNVRTGDIEQYDVFGMIDAASIRRKHGPAGRLLWVEIKLSDWVWNAIQAREVLTLHPDYFRLRRPIERRVYELARKHCGQQARWKCAISVLHRKSGSKSPLKHFRYLLHGITRHDDFPDYLVEIVSDDDCVLFVNRNTMPSDRKVAAPNVSRSIINRLSGDIYEEARSIAPGWDIYYVADRFGAWWSDIGEPKVGNADAFFLKFCRAWQARHGRA